ncbi:MAG: prepilin-type N-terminal cleavage/methylation domain-containing protein [Candidatus Cloacimonetes bacterium]|jgi:type II secretory pathway pseudopilin PulG|nr:prepilin-type N-terminal cleavage/methylation domain-containing protein [Candidatus Cloacimonadota bacterium]
MMKMIKNEKGSTLIELIVVIIISTVLIMVSAIGIVTFFRSYSRIKKNIDLQQGVMECMHLLRHGLLMPAKNENLITLLEYNPTSTEYWGISTARKIQISNVNTTYGYGTTLRITPPISTAQQRNDYLEYYLREGAIRAQYSYNGTQVSVPLYIFPKEADVDNIEVTRFEIYDANKPNLAGAYYAPTSDKREVPIVRVVIEARMLLRDAPLPRDREYETVVYETYIAKKYVTD